MSMRADDLIDRRRLRRKLTFWRVAAVLIVLVAIGAAIRFAAPDAMGGGVVNHIAKVKIEGTITEDEDLLERLEDIREADGVRGVIISIDSPGGTTAGGEALYDAIRRLAAEKPVVAQVGTLAASAGYMIASASDHIVARQSSIIGSIGVLVQYPDVTGLMERLGIRYEAIKSSPLKAEPNPFTPTTDEERAMLQRLIGDSYNWFVDLVSERRSLPRDQVLTLADGSIFTGRQALANRLVDELGGEETAIAWLGTKGVDAELSVIEWKRRDEGGFFNLLGSSRQDSLTDTLEQLISRAGGEHLFLDGLISLWQPPSLAEQR